MGNPDALLLLLVAAAVVGAIYLLVLAHRRYGPNRARKTGEPLHQTVALQSTAPSADGPPRLNTTQPSYAAAWRQLRNILQDRTERKYGTGGLFGNRGGTLRLTVYHHKTCIVLVAYGRYGTRVRRIICSTVEPTVWMIEEERRVTERQKWPITQQQAMDASTDGAAQLTTEEVYRLAVQLEDRDPDLFIYLRGTWHEITA